MSTNLTRTISGNSLSAMIAVTLLVSIFCAAGFWQLHRAHYKDELKARTALAMHDAAIELPATLVHAANLEFRTIHVRGEWVADKTIFIDNKIRESVVGYEVLTPLQIATSGTYVLVNRGWIGALPLRSELPPVLTPAGVVEVSGIARAPTDRFLELSKQVEAGQVWQNLTIERFAEWSKLSLQPTVIFQQNVSNDKLQRVPVAPEANGLGADRHRGYALTWFGLALVTLVLAVAAKLKSKNS